MWVRKGGYLIFSDIPANVIHRWDPADGKVSVLLEKSGFTGVDATGVGGAQTNVRGETIYLIGSNGVTLDPQGRVTFNAMGYRQVFTDPPSGLRRRNDDPKKELPFNGVFPLKGGQLQLLASDLVNPNGITLSPDETILYVNSSADRKIPNHRGTEADHQASPCLCGPSL